MKSQYSTTSRGATDRKTIWVFTPSRTDPRDLESILVQRHGLIGDAVERVKESVHTDHKHHLLFVGPRGCGKTHLTTLVVSRLSQDKKLNGKLRIAWLNEDETCTTLLEFLIRIHTSLEKRYPTEFDGNMLNAAYEVKQSEAQDFVSNQLLTTLGQSALLVVTENLDALFEALGDEEQKRLRSFIQEKPRISILATAQRLVADLSDRTSPFFGFFQTEHLKPLNVEEATELLQNIAQLQEKSGVTEFLGTSRGRSRVRAIHHLSGGNHRIYIVLSQFITHENVDALLDPFMKMVDELTPYYQERIRWLPPMQRKIIEYLCGCDATVPVKEIAKRLFSTPQSVSSQLQDLREKGYVQSHQRGRESLYEISEPMMRICVEVKDNQLYQPLRLLVDFLRVWYEDHELKNLLREMEPSSSGSTYFRSAVERNLAEGNLRKQILLNDYQVSFPNEILGEFRDSIVTYAADLPEDAILGLQFLNDGKIDQAQQCFQETLDSMPDQSSRDCILKRICNALLIRAITYGESGEVAHAIRDYTSLIELPGAPGEQVANAYLFRGVAHGESGDVANAITDYTSLIELPGVPVGQVAAAFFNRGVAHGESGDVANAITDYTSLIELPEAPIALVARAFLNRGITFEESGEVARAITDYTSLIGLPGAPVDQVAKAFFNRGVVHFQNGWKQESQTDFEAITGLSDAPVEFLSHGYLALALLHFSEGRWSEGFQSLDKGLDLRREVRTAILVVGVLNVLVGVFFNAGLSPEGRQSRITELLRMCEKYGALPGLGEAVVQHIGDVFRRGVPFPSADNLEGWAAAWELAAGNVPDFRLSMRLLRTGINFVRAGGKDPGTLLVLTSPERAILEQALGLQTKGSMGFQAGGMPKHP